MGDMKMDSLKVNSSQARYLVVGIILTLATIISAILPALVSAAQLNERSMTLSSSSAEATGVQYDVSFGALGTAGAFVIEFCGNSPLIGQTCDAPVGFSAATATSATVGFTDVVGTANKVVVTGAIAPGQVDVALSGMTNPDEAGTMYARIVTYDTDTNADLYQSQALGNGVIDTGSVAMAITDTVGVSGAVLESMTFCVSKVALGENCAGATAPILQLGETVGTTVALVPGQVSEGTLNTQISTNAVGGAVVRIKSNAEGCGGMLRAGAPTACDIAPAMALDVTGAAARFGVKVAAPTATGLNPLGTLVPVVGSVYADTGIFALSYDETEATGVTSVFGDPFLSTGDAPANNQNVELTFGASVTNATPAGLYSADLSLIATGKF